MLTLGIETSCDETAASVVENGRKVLSNTIASQIKLHQKTGGVVPEVAAREHVLKIVPVVKQAIKEAKVKIDDIDLIGVTQGPGLISSLMIGTCFASAFALVKKIPIVPVNHIDGHIYANWLYEKDYVAPPKFPIIVLTVSGGHNELILMKNHDKFELIGETLDDAAGEAFDKVARLLGLGYPGGPVISKVAEKGDPNRFNLPRAWLNNWNPPKKYNFNFSFSGLKTAVLRLTKDKSQKDTNDIAASFQEAVCEVLAIKLTEAAKKYKPKEVHLAGGVSANKRLRKMVEEKSPKGMKLRYPQNIKFCTDNGAMIATSAYFKYKKSPSQYKKWRNVIAEASFR